MEHEEYTAENYPSFGKKYNDEKAIISLTSWRERINTVAKTLFSLLKQCPGFHIVLVLSEEEFPKMMDELPENLKLFVNNELIELMFVYKNYKSFKKVLFTMDKYRDVPVISADDDCIYTCNYAQELYNAWVKDKESIWTFHKYKNSGITFQHGPTTIYPLYCFPNALKILNNEIENTFHDDVFYGYIAYVSSIKVKEISDKLCYKFHDEIDALSKGKTTSTEYAIKVCEKFIK